MADKAVTARVDVNGNVTLTGEAGLPDRLTFKVRNGDTLRWNLENMPQDGSRARVKFVDFPSPANPVQLVERGSVLTSEGSVIVGGLVNVAALVGRYLYKVFLVGPTGLERELECRWSDGTPIGMGGGEKSGKPTG